YEFDSWSAFPTRSFLLDDHPDLAGSHIRAIIPHPSDPTIYFISNSLYIVEVHVDTNTIEFIYTAGDSDLPDLGTITLTSPTGNPDWLIGEGTSWTYEPLGLVETLDGGESWQYGSSFPCEYGSWVEPGGRVYAPGDEGLLYSDNQAETWHTLIPSSQLPPAYHTFEHGRVAVAPSDSSVVWIAPYYNEFYRTENRGESWQLIEALQTFTTPTIITTGHSDSEVVYASQGIQLWSLLDQDEDIWELRSIIPSFVSRLQLSADNQTLFRAFHWTNPEDVYGGEIGRSNDGGWTWEWQNQFLLESLPNNLSNAAMHPTGPDTIYAILDDQSIQSFKTFCRSEDFGQVWQQSSGIPWTSCIDRYIYVDPYHPERVYVWLGQNLYRSLDHGRSFEQLSELVGVFFRPNSRSLIGATTTTIKVSDDEGDNWQELDPPPGYGDIQRVSHLPGTELGLLVVREDGIWSSWHTDVDWQPGVLPFVAEDLTSSVAFSADETLYVGHVGIWVGRDVVSVDENNSPIPNTHDLNINIYPNPFNGSAVLQYSLPSPSTVRIQIFDILGRIVLTLPYNKQYQGTQTIPLDISSHPSGTYFVSIDMGESNYGIKKLILIK
ncbi:MAG TPA: T9SS type A sorting domain-containing protein, partial [Bacteroidetes bacterium]|nr:T9SS type A sorting domain-containing protein [Bacteroidota bacterium]HEX05568.1 T9SS type A sorting domain-containing protein [Bacteroidota bacterium]